VKRHRVAVTGLGLVTPLGTGVEKSWSRLLTGRSAIRPITRFDASNFPVSCAAEVPDFVSEDIFSADELEWSSLAARFAAAAADEAMEDAGLEIETPERAGVLIGVGLGLLADYDYLRAPSLLPEADNRNFRFIPRTLGHMAAVHISRRIGLKGPLSAVSTACCSGANAIGEAKRLIEEGAADIMFAGGTESCIFELALSGFHSMKCLAARNGGTATAMRPFDARRDGFVMGEGAGVLVLERWDLAAARGARIYAEAAGYGTNTSACHITQSDPTGESQARCMRLALEDGGVADEEIGYINAHGSATVSNDKCETLAIKKAFGRRAFGVPISSTKAMTGHLLGAAGAVEAVFSILALHRQILPPTINYSDADPECDLDYIPNAPRRASVRHVLSNSFAFGGVNASLLLSAPS